MLGDRIVCVNGTSLSPDAGEWRGEWRRVQPGRSETSKQMTLNARGTLTKDSSMHIGVHSINFLQCEI